MKLLIQFNLVLTPIGVDDPLTYFLTYVNVEKQLE